MIGEEKVTMEEGLDTDQEVIDTEEIDFDTKVKESKISQVKHFCRRNWKKAVAVGGVLASVAIGYVGERKCGDCPSECGECRPFAL